MVLKSVWFARLPTLQQCNLSPPENPWTLYKNWCGVTSVKVRHGIAHATPESASPPPKTGSPLGANHMECEHRRCEPQVVRTPEVRTIQGANTGGKLPAAAPYNTYSKNSSWIMF